MTLPTDVLPSQVLELPTAECAKLLSQVVSSLDADAERDARWNATAAQRDAEAESDPSVLVSAAKALARLRTAAA